MSVRRAVIIGGSASVAPAIVGELAGRGYDLVIGYRNGGDAAEECAAVAQGHGVEASVARVDLEDVTSIDAFAEALGDAPIDVLVHAAGAFEEAPLKDTTEAMFLQQVRTNAVGPALLTERLRQRLAASAQRDGACVVFFGDIHADMLPRGGATAYLASKGATHALVRMLAIELAPTRVVGIAPGVVSWPQDWSRERRDAYLQRVPLGREGTAQDVARLLGALVESAGYVTGTIIPLDGGRHLR